MKILFCGGGSGGHFYPLIAVAEALRDVTRKKKIIQPQLFYLASDPYDLAMLFDNEIEFHKISSGKIRRYFSIRNFIDIIKTFLGFISVLIKVYSIFPDIIFSKGGMMSLPVVISGKILGIPVIIHESDSVPGKANIYASKFAKRIAISYPETADYFDKSKTALTGNPIRQDVITPVKEGATEYLGLEPNTPVLFILGGSLGAKRINDELVMCLPTLLNEYQIIHQTGKLNYDDIVKTASVVIQDHKFEKRYHPFDYMNALAERMSAGVASLVISRGGSTIFEIAAWGLPSIIIPITEANGDHQRKNAYNYARTGAALVIEENNLTPEILTAQIKNLMNDPERLKKMREAALGFAKTDAAYKVADELINIALKHEA
ncbi:MAG: UDP-N-acetylglucosamine--N-acetylmuramyl-(pentapeptide) pyrophosphoryl-undecaprenol N-acetylglucosamine transferase [Candidatus Paceibacterota bacterium]